VIVQPLCFTLMAIQFAHTELFWTSLLTHPHDYRVLLLSVPYHHLLVSAAWSALLLIFVVIVTFAYLGRFLIVEIRSEYERTTH